MKKIFVILVALIGLGFSANSQEKKAENSSLLEYSNSTSSKTVSILVKANKAVDDLCNYFDGSIVDYGLKIYCKFGGDIYTCTSYKVVSAACAINGAVRLYIEGDMDSALIRFFNGFSDVPLLLSKENGNFVLSR